MTADNMYGRVKVAVGLWVYSGILVIWTAISWYNAFIRVLSFFTGYPTSKSKMAAPAAEKISRASEDSPERLVAGTTPDPDPDSPDRGYFQPVPAVSTGVRQKARAAEDQLLTLIRRPFTRFDVELASRGIFIHTLQTRLPSTCSPDTVPLLLIHGLATGLGAWTISIDELAQNRQVFAIDLLGFGLSSRFEFGDDARTVEQQYVHSIDEWRQKMGIRTFILCGHSMGGYLSCAYALRYPENVVHLILDDPWGMPESNRLTHKVGSLLMAESMPYFRGPRIVRETSMVFLNRAFKAFDRYHGGAGTYFKDYLLAINQAEPPTGEKAFGTLAMLFGLRARAPMMSRIQDLDERVGVTLLIGERSFLPYTYIQDLPEKCCHLRLNVKLIQGADHEIHITESQQFNDIVNSVCDRVDDLVPCLT